MNRGSARRLPRPPKPPELKAAGRAVVMPALRRVILVDTGPAAGRFVEPVRRQVFAIDADDAVTSDPLRYYVES